MFLTGFLRRFGPEAEQNWENFYSCSKYPTCTFAIWDKPINRPCPQCQSPFLIETYKKQTGATVLCRNQECGYEEKGQERKRLRANSRLHALLMLKDLDGFALALNNVFRNHDFLHIRLRRNIIHYIEHDRL